MLRYLSPFAVLVAAVWPAVAAEPAAVVAKKTETAVEFFVGSELVARYHVGQAIAKPYLWPLNAPGEVPVTRGWPMQKGLPNETIDHVHQKSAWFCHGDVIPEGLELQSKSSDKRVKGVDFWSETPGHGRIVVIEVVKPTSEIAQARVATKNEWRGPDGTKIMDENRTITVRNLGNARLVILDIDLHASVCPITFGDTKEGSMGVRVNDEIRVAKGNGTYVNADSKKNEKEVWGRRSDWNDYSGKVGEKEAGIALFDDPRNKVRASWHSRDYGLMSANPFGRAGSFPSLKEEKELFKLAKGEHLKLRYGLLLHAGDAKAAKVAEHYSAFAKE
ncbi:MAG: hypothetical protein EXS09_21900 [Gemmataceae bacterium]|nr:hypothetical protein [Gemmataceae bacterium]